MFKPGRAFGIPGWSSARLAHWAFRAWHLDARRSSDRAHNGPAATRAAAGMKAFASLDPAVDCRFLCTSTRQNGNRLLGFAHAIKTCRGQISTKKQ